MLLVMFFGVLGNVLFQIILIGFCKPMMQICTIVLYYCSLLA